MDVSERAREPLFSMLRLVAMPMRVFISLNSSSFRARLGDGSALAVRTPTCTGPQKRPKQSADGSVAERILERLLVSGSAPIDTERPPHRRNSGEAQVPNSMPHAQGIPRMPSGMHFTSASRTLSEALKASPFLNTPAEWRVDINPRAHPPEYPGTRRGWWARGQTIFQQAAERDSPPACANRKRRRGKCCADGSAPLE